ncbi:hypothetical protein KW805_03295 [Candidatus Pacearchaeota archaeon]|nr:hypothetical protein [Candidatus Pacearchaeota archaeon]
MRELNLKMPESKEEERLLNNGDLVLVDKRFAVKFRDLERGAEYITPNSLRDNIVLSYISGPNVQFHLRFGIMDADFTKCYRGNEGYEERKNALERAKLL